MSKCKITNFYCQINKILVVKQETELSKLSENAENTFISFPRGIALTVKAPLRYFVEVKNFIPQILASLLSSENRKCTYQMEHLWQITRSHCHCWQMVAEWGTFDIINSFLWVFSRGSFCLESDVASFDQNYVRRNKIVWVWSLVVVILVQDGSLPTCSNTDWPPRVVGIQLPGGPSRASSPLATQAI